MKQNSVTKSVTVSEESKPKLNIVPRKVRFDYADINSADFHGGNIVASAFWVGLSTTFPTGEAEFINSVKLFKPVIKDKKLLEEISDFSAQEAHHALQHRKLNKQFTKLGYDIEAIEKIITEKIAERSYGWSPLKRLRRTVSAEHFTATMAHYALLYPQSLDAGPEVFKNLLLWHAIEEVEHKSVAFDVYLGSGGSMTALKAHYVHFAFIEFPFQMWLITRFLLKQGGFKVTWKQRLEFLKLLFGKDGMYGAMASHYFKFLKKGFHPWQVESTEAVTEWKDVLSPYFINQENTVAATEKA